MEATAVRGELAVGPSCPWAGRWLAALLCCGLLSLFGSRDFRLNDMHLAFLLAIIFLKNN